MLMETFAYMPTGRVYLNFLIPPPPTPPPKKKRLSCFHQSNVDTHAIFIFLTQIRQVIGPPGDDGAVGPVVSKNLFLMSNRL